MKPKRRHGVRAHRRLRAGVRRSEPPRAGLRLWLRALGRFLLRLLLRLRLLLGLRLGLLRLGLLLGDLLRWALLLLGRAARLASFPPPRLRHTDVLESVYVSSKIQCQGIRRFGNTRGYLKVRL